MNIPAPRPMDSAAFLAWAEGREGRYELANGRVVMMTGGSRRHAPVVHGLSTALNVRLAGTQWVALTSDLGVRIDTATVRYPDVVVEARGAKRRELAAATPVLIAEVLSPSSVTNDVGDKATEYLRLTSLSAYVVFSQDEPKARLWVRQRGNFPAGPWSSREPTTSSPIPSLSVELPLGEIDAEFLRSEDDT